MSDDGQLDGQRDAAVMRRTHPLGSRWVTASGRVVTIREHGGNYFVGTFDDPPGAWEMWDTEGLHATDGTLKLFPLAQEAPARKWWQRFGSDKAQSPLAALLFVTGGALLGVAAVELFRYLSQ